MGRVSQKAGALFRAVRFPFWGLRFHVYGLTGTCRYGGEQLRVLYAGTQPFFHYFKLTAFSEPPKEEFFGSYNIYELDRARQGLCWDLELFRSHKLFVNSGLFPSDLFIPEWLSGVADLTQQKNIEDTSRSRKRDRNLMSKNDISYSVTTETGDLDYFYDEMYWPHMHQKHGESVFLMSRDEMMSRVSSNQGELLMIQMGKEAVGGSFIFYEDGRPRLFSQGVLRNDKDLMRRGVGTAIYLCSFDYLAKNGFREVHMGWSRAVLSDGSLYFKQRFGMKVEGTSAIGHFLKYSNASEAAKECLKHMGFIHYRRGKTKAALFRKNATADSDGVHLQKQDQVEALGLDGIDVINLSQSGRLPVYQRSRAKAEQSTR
jgi:hypothetical protein